MYLYLNITFYKTLLKSVQGFFPRSFKTVKQLEETQARAGLLKSDTIKKK